ncbi:MAG TPA: CPBP family glutamic-type intramembrane protease, partial [Myxococcota bacterium]|nr:CPBP family glutamic-type intramembrane protease [Myxococcota bacterium]
FVGGPLAIARRAFAGPRPGARLGVAAVALAAVVLSSLAFSLAHHLGAIEPPAAYVFWYRALAGIVFGGVFLARGFAVAAYAHFLYDVLVMLL